MPLCQFFDLWASVFLLFVRLAVRASEQRLGLILLQGCCLPHTYIHSHALTLCRTYTLSHSLSLCVYFFWLDQSKTMRALRTKLSTICYSDACVRLATSTAFGYNYNNNSSSWKQRNCLQAKKDNNRQTKKNNKTKTITTQARRTSWRFKNAQIKKYKYKYVKRKITWNSIGTELESNWNRIWFLYYLKGNWLSNSATTAPNKTKRVRLRCFIQKSTICSWFVRHITTYLSRSLCLARSVALSASVSDYLALARARSKEAGSKLRPAIICVR